MFSPPRDADREARHSELQAALDEQMRADDDVAADDAEREAAGLRTVLLTASTLQLTTRVALVRIHAEACCVRATTLPTTSRYTPRMSDYDARSEASEVETLHWGIMQCLEFHESHTKRLRLESYDACRQVRACLSVRISAYCAIRSCFCAAPRAAPAAPRAACVAACRLR